MIEFKNKQGDFKFEKVEDLRKFLLEPDITDHDVRNFGYLISNICGHEYSKLSAFCSGGTKIFLELRQKGMDQMVRDLK